MKAFIKKHWSTLFFFVFLLLILIPQTGTPIRVFMNRMISFSPSVIDENDREQLTSYSWSLLDEKGERVDFKQSEGHVVLVNIWATWCPPCIAELPALENLYNQMGAEVDFYFVTSEAPDTVKSFLAKKGFDIPVYFPLDRTPKELETGSLPTTYLIDAKGAIVIKKKGAANWDSDSVLEQIKKLLE